ncbi:MAG TPA: hypothetical protein VM328_10700, partial [Fimbriimonadaceae bacterium]|nr:hypothetical protein [Fimbriimonadaceae bacterium]
MRSLPNLRPSNVGRLGVFLVFAVGFGLLFGAFGPALFQWIYNLIPGNRSTDVYAGNLITTGALALTGAIVGIGIASLIIRLFENMFRSWEDMDSGEKVTLFLGIFAGLIASVPFLFLFSSFLAGYYVPFAILGVTVGFSALAVYALQSMADVLPWYRGKTRSRRRGIKVLDTNVIIDGRVLDVVRNGFLEGQIYVPGFVLEELQHIADSHDPLKRQRGRRGLDVLRHLQTDFPLEVGTHDRFAGDPNEEV